MNVTNRRCELNERELKNSKLAKCVERCLKILVKTADNEVRKQLIVNYKLR